MLSNHYPMTYGSEKNVLILLLLFVLGASVRHYKITKEKVGILPAVLIMASLAGLAYLTMQRNSSESATFETKLESKSIVTAPIDLSQAGAISIDIKFYGEVPSPKKIAATPECVSANGKPLLNEGLISQSGKLQNAFVWISEGMEGKSFPSPSEELVIDQRECAYRPRVVGVQVGQPITFLNSDSFVHNVHSMAKENEKFNLSLSNKNQKITRRLMKPEIMLRSKCDIHPWMSGFIGVVSHPYFGVSNEKGEVLLNQVPPGTYTVSAWHETLGVKTQKVELGQKGNQKIEFVFP
jgi:plastocyanin